MFHKLAWLGFAGALGTLARYGLAGLVHRIHDTTFPLGTVVVNVAGCLAAGLIWALVQNRWPVTGETRTLILVGFMGSFTTFSSLIMESGVLMRSGDWVPAMANLTLQNTFGLAALFAGMALGRFV